MSKVSEFVKSEMSPKDKFMTYFPMGVFGTLRENQCNNGLMHGRERFTEAKAGSKTYVTKHRNAFLPHFYAEGLGIRFEADACSPFEIFEYEEKDWSEKIMNPVDRLESFSVDSYEAKGGYYRTLANLRVLPDDYSEGFGKVQLWGRRDLKIPVEDWEKFPKMACWIYSSPDQNKKTVIYCREKGIDCPILWPVKV